MAGRRRMQKDLVTAANVMVREVKKVSQSMRVKDLIQYLAHMQVSGVPVVDEAGKLVGVVSETDLVKAQAHLEVNDRFCLSFYEFDPFAGQVGYFEECGLKVLDMRVRDLMTREVITVLPEDPLDLVIKRMLAHGIHRLIVAKEGVIFGLISTLDIIQALASDKIAIAPAIKVADLMSESILVGLEDMLIKELINILSDKDVTGLPVVREDGTVIGVISQADIVRNEAEINRKRYVYPDFYSLDPFMKKVPLVRDFDREVLGRGVKEFMTLRVISVTPDTPITAAAKTMVGEQVHRLLVVDPEGRIKGIIATMDLLKALAEA